MNKPGNIWWVAHLFLGPVSGFIVHARWFDKNPDEAERHLNWSILMWPAGVCVVGVGVANLAYLAVPAVILSLVVVAFMTNTGWPGAVRRLKYMRPASDDWR